MNSIHDSTVLAVSHVIWVEWVQKLPSMQLYEPGASNMHLLPIPVYEYLNNFEMILCTQACFLLLLYASISGDTSIQSYWYLYLPSMALNLFMQLLLFHGTVHVSIFLTFHSYIILYNSSIHTYACMGAETNAVVSDVVSFVLLELINHWEYEISACLECNLCICCISNPV